MTAISESVLPIIRRTREMLLPHYGSAEEVARKGTSAHNVVTALDIEVERFLADEVGKIDPDAEFSGEENGGGRDAKRFWLCDPIDGTALFIRGIPFCTVMLALIEEGRVNFSVIYDFVNDELYHAERGKGAFKNDEPIKVSDRDAKDAYVAYETHINKKENMERFLRLREKVGLVKYMCAGYEYALVASGKLEGRVNFDPWGHDWDYAPGSLLVEEAGGIVANLGVRTYDYRNYDFLAASPAFFQAMTEGPDAIFPTNLSS